MLLNVYRKDLWYLCFLHMFLLVRINPIQEIKWPRYILGKQFQIDIFPFCNSIFILCRILLEQIGIMMKLRFCQTHNQCLILLLKWLNTRRKGKSWGWRFHLTISHLPNNRIMYLHYNFANIFQCYISAM